MAVPELDDMLHAKARLGIMTLLAASGDQDFTSLKEHLRLTDGNLGAHIRVLEDAGHIEVEKTFEGRRPKTKCRLTQKGKCAFSDYLEKLEQLIRLASR